MSAERRALLDHRRGVGRPGEAARRAARRRGARRDPRRDGARRRLRDAPGRATRRLRHRLGADPVRVRARLRSRIGRRRCARRPAGSFASRRKSGIATILVGHVTKDGSVAGPRVLEHLVDCVLQFEGDRYHAHRVLRATKNRFGSTNELGVFEMTGAGLVGVPDPSELFGRTVDGEPGSGGRLRARGDAADPARDPGPRRAERARDAAPGRDRHRPEAARDDRRRARAPRRSRARPGGRVRERRRRRADRRARRRPRGRARDRLGRPPRCRRDPARPPSARSG